MDEHPWLASLGMKTEPTPTVPPNGEPPEAGEESTPGTLLAVSAPQTGVPAPARRLPQRAVKWSTPKVWIVGAHGGSGESTLSALLQDSRPADHHWPVHPQEPQPVILVARSHASGLEAVRNAATEWASGVAPVRLIGLVIVADAPGKLPRSLRDLLTHVSGGIPQTWFLPWVEAWRLGEPPAPGNTPRRIETMLKEIHQRVENFHAEPHS